MPGKWFSVIGLCSLLSFSLSVMLIRKFGKRWIYFLQPIVTIPVIVLIVLSLVEKDMLGSGVGVFIFAGELWGITKISLITTYFLLAIHILYRHFFTTHQFSSRFGHFHKSKQP
jgi:hypothetical protein